MNKNSKKKLENYKHLGEKIENINELLVIEEKTEKKFFFVVRQPFDGYQKGERITNKDEIERIERDRLLSLVMRVNVV